MTKPQLVIAHLYPDEMNIYGDTGNILTVVKRLEWRGIGARVDRIAVDQHYDFKRADLVFGGGGQDRGQTIVATDLQKRGDDLRAAAESGIPMLLVCGLYQLFGQRFVTADGTVIPGIGVFGAETIAGPERLIGNVVIKSAFGRLVGFENHSGQTRLLEGQPALGHVIKGFGNDSTSQQEGAQIHNVFGTYLHGPILPKNPILADQLIKLALGRRYPKLSLDPLDDTLETAAAATAASRPQ